jgi:S-adenosyl-L-methionine hydrolase (adenosine-forming)
MSFKPLITLTTDFGNDDPFAGVIKGVIYSINPEATIVDLTHSIPPQNILQAAFAIGMNYHYFPEHSVHVVVVDPGVGSERRPILVSSAGHYFIGPDNGLFSHIYKSAEEDPIVVHITSSRYFLKEDSPTFQGRDIFSPCAAWLSTGMDISRFGERIADYKRIDLPMAVRHNAHLLRGEVIFNDRFGNAVTNIEKADVLDLRGAHAGAALQVLFKGRKIGLCRYYSEAENRGLNALLNSSDLLEIFLYKGSAASEYQILPGDILEVVLSLPSAGSQKTCQNIPS